MIIVKIVGGLGNQMFQYAYAKALEQKGYEVKLDISTFETYKLHGGYQLDKYTINLDTSSVEENSDYYSNSFMYKILMKLGLVKSKIIKEKSLSFDSLLLSLEDDSYVAGYFQNEKYFLSIRDELIANFTIKCDISNYAQQIEKQILVENISVSLHIRRGDYISNKNANSIHGTCDLKYYEKAMSLMNDKFKNIKYFIFSDDMAWVKENLKFKNATYIDSKEKRIPHEDIYLMSLCKHNIIANSSFSWWGAWLNQNEDKLIIAPKRWFSDTTMFEQSHDIVCKKWIKL